MLVLRFVPIALAFGLGALVAWQMKPVPESRQESVASAPAVAPAGRVETAAVEAQPEDTVGVPPDTVTLPSSHPKAGQKRALARVLEDLERNPPTQVDPPKDFDPEAAASFAGSLAAALAEGESR